MLLKTKKLIYLQILQSFLFNYKKQSYLARKKGKGGEKTQNPLTSLCQYITYNPLSLSSLLHLFYVYLCMYFEKTKLGSFCSSLVYFSENRKDNFPTSVFLSYIPLVHHQGHPEAYRLQIFDYENLETKRGGQLNCATLVCSSVKLLAYSLQVKKKKSSLLC